MKVSGSGDSGQQFRVRFNEEVDVREQVDIYDDNGQLVDKEILDRKEPLKEPLKDYSFRSDSLLSRITGSISAGLQRIREVVSNFVSSLTSYVARRADSPEARVNSHLEGGTERSTSEQSASFKLPRATLSSSSSNKSETVYATIVHSTPPPISPHDKLSTSASGSYHPEVIYAQLDVSSKEAIYDEVPQNPVYDTVASDKSIVTSPSFPTPKAQTRLEPLYATVQRSTPPPVPPHGRPSSPTTVSGNNTGAIGSTSRESESIYEDIEEVRKFLK